MESGVRMETVLKLIVECNFSCPQMVGEGLGCDVGQNPELVRAYTAGRLRGSWPATTFGSSWSAMKI